MKTYKIFIIILLLIFSINNKVFSDDELSDTSFDFDTIPVDSNISTEPIINSRSAIIFDRTSGKILFGKNENEKRKMASTTKILTAITVLENTNLDDIVTVSSNAAQTGGSRLGLHTDDKISVRNLLYGLLLCSGNDAAVALAEYTGGSISSFANMMNKKCEDLKLTSTHFVTPHGLDDDNHYTTAYELALITNYALQNKTFSNYVSTKNHTITINNSPRNLSNTNELLGNLYGVYGVKTGFTNGANRCLVTSVKRGNLDLICVVLGADTKKDRTKDSINLIEYAFNNFELLNIKEKIENEFNNWKSYNSTSFTIEKGISNDVELKIDEIPYDFYPVNCNQKDNINIYINCNKNHIAPLPENTVIGYISVTDNNNQILKINIYNSNSISLKSFSDYFVEIIGNYIYHLESIFFY